MILKKKIIFRLFLLVIILLVTALFLWFYINKYLYKSKASIDRVYVTNLGPTLINVDKNQEFNASFKFSAENGKKISGISLSIFYDRYAYDTVDYLGFSQLPENYFQVIQETTIPNAQGFKLLQIRLVASKPESQLNDNVVLNFRFKTKNKDEFSLVEIVGREVVGTTANYEFETVLPQLITVAIGNTQLSPTPTLYPTFTPTPTRTPTSTLTITPTPNPSITPTRTPTLTPTISSNSVVLNLALKFQGVTKKPSDDFNNFKVKIIAIDSNGKRSQPVFANFQAKDEGERKGVWKGQVSLNISPGEGYKILVKGPKHIQKKICDPDPSESSLGPGTYFCQSDLGKINLRAGENNLDFYGIYLLVGDLPIAGDQDGVINSLDTSFIRNNLGSRDPQVLEIADLNLDGVVDSQDWSLVIAALSIRGDEE